MEKKKILISRDVIFCERHSHLHKILLLHRCLNKSRYYHLTTIVMMRNFFITITYRSDSTASTISVNSSHRQHFSYRWFTSIFRTRNIAFKPGQCTFSNSLNYLFVGDTRIRTWNSCYTGNITGEFIRYNAGNWFWNRTSSAWSWFASQETTYKTCRLCYDASPSTISFNNSLSNW